MYIGNTLLANVMELQRKTIAGEKKKLYRKFIAISSYFKLMLKNM
jgi:hypothetical protein